MSRLVGGRMPTVPMDSEVPRSFLWSYFQILPSHPWTKAYIHTSLVIGLRTLTTVMFQVRFKNCPILRFLEKVLRILSRWHWVHDQVYLTKSHYQPAFLRE